MKVQINAADETLVALYAQGNNEAFDILLNRYKDRLYAFLTGKLQNTYADKSISSGYMDISLTIRQQSSGSQLVRLDYFFCLKYLHNYRLSIGLK